jgi:hypothetical protein
MYRWNQVTIRESTDKIMPNLDEVNRNIRALALDLTSKLQALQNMVADQNSETQRRDLINLRECVRSAATIVSSASTILATENGDRSSVIDGSDFGDCFSSEPSETMLRWISSNTVYEGEEDPVPQGQQNAFPESFKNPFLDEATYHSESDSDIEQELVKVLFRKGKEKVAAMEYDNAERILRNCLSRISITASGSALSLATVHSISRTEVMDVLVEAYISQQKWTEARTILLDKLSLAQRLLGKGDKSVLLDISTLVDVLFNKGDYVEGHLYARKGLKGYRKLGADGTTGVERMLEMLVKISHADSKFDEEDAYEAMLSDFIDKRARTTLTTEVAVIASNKPSTAESNPPRHFLSQPAFQTLAPEPSSFVAPYTSTNKLTRSSSLGKPNASDSVTEKDAIGLVGGGSPANSKNENKVSVQYGCVDRRYGKLTNV